jgi:hypothetical protein
MTDEDYLLESRYEEVQLDDHERELLVPLNELTPNQIFEMSFTAQHLHELAIPRQRSFGIMGTL